MVKVSGTSTPIDQPPPPLSLRRKAADDDADIANGRSGKKPRTRVSYSCGECHRRKQKCDRQMPCSHCIARKVPELCKAYTPGKTDQDLHHRLSRLENIVQSALPQFWNNSSNGDVNSSSDHHRSPSVGPDDDSRSQGDEEEGIFESGKWYGPNASGIVTAPVVLQKLQDVVDTSSPDGRTRPPSGLQTPSEVIARTEAESGHGSYIGTFSSRQATVSRNGLWRSSAQNHRAHP